MPGKPRSSCTARTSSCDFTESIKCTSRAESPGSFVSSRARGSLSLLDFRRLYRGFLVLGSALQFLEASFLRVGEELFQIGLLLIFERLQLLVEFVDLGRVRGLHLVHILLLAIGQTESAEVPRH